jgi:hypothetical protein
MVNEGVFLRKRAPQDREKDKRTARTKEHFERKNGLGASTAQGSRIWKKKRSHREVESFAFKPFSAYFSRGESDILH